MLEGAHYCCRGADKYMTYSPLAISVVSVLSLSLGYASVFSARPKTRYRCAVGYIVFITLGSVFTLFEKSEFERLIDAGIIGIAMAPVIALWIIVLNKRNQIKISQENLRRLQNALSAGKFAENSSVQSRGSKEEVLSLQIK